MSDEYETDPQALAFFALEDATVILVQETDLPPEEKTKKADKADLTNWLDREPTEKEWETYKAVLETALRKGLLVVDNLMQNR